MNFMNVRFWALCVAALVGMLATPVAIAQACQTWVLTDRPDGPFARMFRTARELCPNIPVCETFVDGNRAETEKLIDSGRVPAAFLPITQLRGMGHPDRFAVVANTGLVHYHMLTVRLSESEHRPPIFPNDALPFGVFAGDMYVADALTDKSFRPYVQLSPDEIGNLTASGLAAAEMMRKNKIRALLVSGERTSVRFPGQKQAAPWLDTVDFATVPPAGFLTRKDAKDRRILAESTAMVAMLPIEPGAHRVLSSLRACLSENFQKLRLTDTQWQTVERLDVSGFAELPPSPQVRKAAAKKK